MEVRQVILLGLMLAVAMVATTVWAVVGAVNTARDRNRAVRATRPQLSVAPAPFGGVSVGLRLFH